MGDKPNYKLELAIKIAAGDLGIYPAAVIENGVERKRTEWQDGWNAASMEILNRAVVIEDYFAGLELNARDKLAEMIAYDDVVCIRVNYKTKEVVLEVNCNDLFAWACADSEDFTIEEINEVYKHFKKGTTDFWCCKHRGQKPQEPIISDLKERGLWNAEWEAIDPEHPSNQDHKKNLTSL